MKLEDPTIEKIAQYCDVETDQVISVIDVPSLYHVGILQNPSPRSY